MKRDQPRATCRWTWIDQWCVETEEVIVHYRLPSMYASLFSHTHCLHYKQRVGGEMPLTSTRGLLVCTAFLTSLFFLSLSLSIDGENAKMKKRQEMVYILYLWCQKSAFDICLFRFFYYSPRYPTHQGCHRYGEAMEKYSSGGSENHLTQDGRKD